MKANTIKAQYTILTQNKKVNFEPNSTINLDNFFVRFLLNMPINIEEVLHLMPLFENTRPPTCKQNIKLLQECNAILKFFTFKDKFQSLASHLLQNLYIYNQK